MEARCEGCGAAQRAGPYRIEKLIAQTAHSRVYEARDSADGRVALKELVFSLVPSTEALDAFHREAEVLLSLEHPRIPRYVAEFTEGRGVHIRLYLAQGLVVGESLEKRISEHGALPEAEVWDIAEQVLKVLGDLHGRAPALIHRDVKPANLVRQADGTLSLVDFGTARGLSQDITHGSTLVGTVGYMAPEQMGGTVDASSDLYALGATLVHALSGVRPLEMVEDAMVLAWERHVRASPRMTALLRALLAPRRSERVRSAKDALVLLRPGVRVREVASEVPSRKSGWTNARVCLLVAVAVSATMGAGAALWIAASRETAPVDVPVWTAPSPPTLEAPLLTPGSSRDHRHFRTPAVPRPLAP